MMSCDVITRKEFVERPDEEQRRKLNWGSMEAAQQVVWRLQNEILTRATELYEGGMSVEDALAQAKDEQIKQGRK